MARPAFEEFEQPPEQMWRVELTEPHGLKLIRYMASYAAVQATLRKVKPGVRKQVSRYDLANWSVTNG